MTLPSNDSLCDVELEPAEAMRIHAWNGRANLLLLYQRMSASS